MKKKKIFTRLLLLRYLIILVVLIAGITVFQPGYSQGGDCWTDSKGAWVAIGPSSSVFVCPYTPGVESCRYPCPQE